MLDTPPRKICLSFARRLWQNLRDTPRTPEQPRDGAYRLRRSARAKRARIAVYPDRIEVVAPSAMPLTQLEEFVGRHWQWAQDKLAQLAEQAIGNRQELGNGTLLPYQGEHFPLTVTEHAGPRASRVAFDRHFQVKLPLGLEAAARQKLLKEKLETWYRKQVGSQAQRLARHHATRHNLHPRSIAVRDQKTRWGSCGPRGNININWRLILAPPAVLEYVVVHEICHLRYRNHAKPFWDLVEDHLPHYREQRRWLKQHGHTLMAVLAD